MKEEREEGRKPEGGRTVVMTIEVERAMTVNASRKKRRD